ncbi:MAG: ATP-dependent Clp protease ATP-binding subunit [Bacteroidales bacterium]|nr:ATP-dependent Clp protease ATP-binding subunit [Bacteroidales bacterium]
MDDIIRNIANSYAEEYVSDAIYPSHLFKAVLHKEAGLVPFIEKDMDKDYFYLQDWADVQMRLSPRSARPVRGLELSPESVAVLDEAENYRVRFGLQDCSAVCILASLATPGVGFSFDQLKTLPLTAAEICEAMGAGDAVKTVPAAPSAVSSGSHPAASSGKGIGKYCKDKVKESAEGLLGTVIGFEDEVARICETMGRMNKANVLIVGESGVGKTSLVNAFAAHVASGNVPAFLKDARIFNLDLVSLGADAQYKGEVDDRFKSVLDDIAGIDNSILVIESLDKMFDKQGSLAGTGTMLKAELAKGGLRLLATSSVEGFTKHIETDKELTNKIERMMITAPDDAHCLEILQGAIPVYEEFHGVKVGDGVLEESIRLAKRYLTERALPDSAFDLVDRGMVHVKSSVSADGVAAPLAVEDIYFVISKQSGIPMGKIQTGERDKLMNAEDTLRQRVIGQDYAIGKVLDSVFESRSGLNKKGQPMGSFFFLGPTGTGKTELSKALAQFLFGDESALIRFDMSEFKEEHSVALLYGAPPGYVGYEEGGLLVNKIRQTPYAVVLFDEIEKAHKSVFDLFLQILDEGKLHDRLGRVGDFSNALLLFTSNIGSQFITDSFSRGEIPENNKLMDIMQGYFRPEFLGRLTEIVPFAPISEETVVRIYNIHLKSLLSLLHEQGMELEISDGDLNRIAMKGFNPQFGARPIIGNIRKELRQPLSKMIISGKVSKGDTVVVTAGEDGTPQFKIKK